MPYYPTLVHLHHVHNHPLDGKHKTTPVKKINKAKRSPSSGASNRSRDTNQWDGQKSVPTAEPLPSIQDKFITLFQSGHTPQSASEIHMYDLKMEYGEEYQQAIMDTELCPTLDWCYM